MGAARLITITSALLVTLAAGAGDALGRTGWNKPAWIRDALRAVEAGRYPRVRAMSYWHERWRNSDGVISDLRVNSSEAALRAYQGSVVSDSFVTDAEYLFIGQFVRLASPSSGIYLAAFPDFGATEDRVSEQALKDYEALTGRQVVWAYFSNNWYGGRIEFPSQSVKLIQKMGRTPFVRLMMRSAPNNPTPDPQFNLQQILDGRYDAALRKWAEQARDTQWPILVEFGTEVNGDWFGWSGKWNGAGKPDGYGDKKLADGPERFRDAFRRLVGIFREAQAHNVSWVFHADAQSAPPEPWNSISAYYPGDDYVDWIGVSVYGPQRPGAAVCESFTAILDDVYPELEALSPDKPLAVLEWGIAEPAGRSNRESDSCSAP